MANRVTINDLAKETGLSTAAVSYVLNGKSGVGEEARKAVLEAAERLGYVPNYTARGLARACSQLIGVCIPQTEPGSRLMFSNPFYSEILSSIEYECRANGYHLIISGTDADESYLRLAQERNLDGVIIIGTYNEKFYDDLKKANVPIVLIDTYLEDHKFHNVRIDDVSGGYMGTKYLLEKGHREIAFVSGALREAGVTQLRFEGYRRALSEYGVKLNSNRILAGNVSYQFGMDAVRMLRDKGIPATAAFCTADILAFGMIKKLTDLGVKVPDELSVMGFDNLSICEYASPSITTVGQDIQLKGKKAVELILSEINGEIGAPACVTLPLTIIERKSVK